ncbi:MAG TPA: FGGY family carbohydrate kinase, partial [Thermomicrobiales bacterium]|nr:FGGY family carbohydrate kinase [Thermomicrobiales bacterium]
DPTGAILGLARRTYETAHPRPGWSEQNPADWWRATTEVVRELASALPDTRLAAISLTGQMHGTVLLDADGAAIGPAIIWSDRRSDAQRDEIARAVGPELQARIGGPLGVGYMAATIRWVRDCQPELAAKIAAVLLPKDALGFRLTGIRATEPSDAISTGLLDAESWTWNPVLLEAAGVDAPWLADVLPSGSIAGRLLPGLATELGLEPGIPVVLAGGDAPCAAFGAGVTGSDEAMVVLSSGAQVILPTPGFAPDADGRWHTFPSAVPPTGSGQPRNRVCATSNAGIALEWLAAITGTGVPTLLDRASSVAPGAERALFIPYLTGQRTPILDSLARGSFFGLTDRHTSADLARAVAEGIIFACRHAYATIVAGGNSPSTIRLGGGPSQHPLIRQLVADIFNLPVQPLESPDLTVIGAARSGALALGWADPEPRFDTSTVVTPEPGRVAFYDRLFPLHIDAAEAGREISHRLQAL